MRTLPGILLVDDDATSTFLTQRLLRQLAPADQVLTAGNGAEGLQVLQRVLPVKSAGAVNPWLVLLDLNMPVLNGFEFLEAYQQLPQTLRQQAAVVVLTTSLHSADLERLQQLPIAGVVAKPLTEEKLHTILRESLRRPASSDSGAVGPVLRLLYRSRAMRPLTQDEVYQLLNQARQANEAADLTGLLVYADGRFVQVLEGPEAAVRAVYARIQQDPRHTQVATVGEATGPARHFARWRMALGQYAEPAVAQLFQAALASSAGSELLGEALLQQLSAALPLPPTHPAPRDRGSE